MKKIYCLLVAFAFATLSVMAQLDFSSSLDNQFETGSPFSSTDNSPSFASPSVGVSSLSGSSLGNTSMTFRSAYLDNNLTLAAPFEGMNQSNAMIVPPPPPGADPDDQLPIGDVPFGFMALLSIGFVLVARRRQSC